MNLALDTAAGRSRSADEGAFLRPNVVHRTGNVSSSPATGSPHTWKRAVQERIWSQHGPKGLTARSVLLLLLWHADAQGRVWLGIQAIADKTGAGSLRTVRNALDTLVRQGWLQSSAQTWASLTHEQSVAGRPLPRRGDTGQAPNLYVVLGGQGRTISAGPTESSPPRPGLARGASLDLKATVYDSPSSFRQGGPWPNDLREPLADQLPDPDPKGSPSRIESAERALRVVTDTHLVSKDDSKNQSPTWNLIVEAHHQKTTQVYGLPPLPPDIKGEQRKALALCLEGAAADVRAKLHARTGVERSTLDVQRELATRVMQLYFKHDSEHLRRVKHALRDLPREFHARVTEAMQLILREARDATAPRLALPETQVVPPNPPIETPSKQPLETAHMNTAREARRLLEVLSAPPRRDETGSRPGFEREPATSKVRMRVDDAALSALNGQDKLTIHDKPATKIGRLRAPAFSEEVCGRVTVVSDRGTVDGMGRIVTNARGSD